jgi:hypothetical protein
VSYLDSTEYQAFGLSPDTDDSWITIASSVINQYCRRDTLFVQPYSERLRITQGSHSAKLSFAPLAALAPATSPLVNVQGRYGWPRRGELPETLQEAISATFSLPGSWVSLDPSQVDWEPNGTLTFSSSPLAPCFNEVSVTYTAGLATIPDAVKTACALIVKNAQAQPGMNVKSTRADMLQIEYFSDSLVDGTVKMLLRPWVASYLG